jgi:signal transduction histidine kinase/CheY-like chemotaxis protein
MHRSLRQVLISLNAAGDGLKKVATSLTSKLVSLVRQMRRIGIEGTEDEVLVSNIIMTNTLSLAIGAAMLVIAPVVYALTGKLSILIAIIVELTINASVLLINHYRQRIAASLTLYFLQCVAISYYCLLFGGIIQLQFMVTFLISIICLIFADRKLRRLCFFAAGITLAFVQVGYYFNFVAHIPVDRQAGFTIQSMAIAGVLFLISVVSQPYIRSNDLKYELIKTNNFKRVFVAEVTHELRNPLNTVYMCAQMIKRDIKLNGQLKIIEPLIDQQLYACENARGIINNVLDLAQIEAGKMLTQEEAAGQPQDFFERLIDGNRFVAKIKGIKLQLQIAGMPDVILADWQQLQQIGANLLTNAIKYSHKGSTVYVNVTGSQHEWTIAVKNQGSISADKLPHIFDPFVRDNGSSAKEGRGLGLYIVRNKVTAMGGSINVSSSNDTTVFTVRLPMAQGRKEDIMHEEEDVYNLSNVDILIAEDNAMNALLLARFLSKNECRATVTGNGQELLEKLEEYAATDHLPDVIILDQQMPVMSGMEALVRLKTDTRFKNIPVVFTTGEALEPQMEVKAAGAADVIIKPINEMQLLNVLSKHVRHSSEILRE